MKHNLDRSKSFLAQIGILASECNTRNKFVQNANRLVQRRQEIILDELNSKYCHKASEQNQTSLVADFEKKNQENMTLQARIKSCFKQPKTFLEQLMVISNDKKTRLAKKYHHCSSLFLSQNFYRLESQSREEIISQCQDTVRFADETEKQHFIKIDVEKAALAKASQKFTGKNTSNKFCEAKIEFFRDQPGECSQQIHSRKKLISDE